LLGAAVATRTITRRVDAVKRFCRRRHDPEILDTRLIDDISRRAPRLPS
jgi:hypothetical protein